MAAVQTVVRMMRRVVTVDGGGGEGVEAGQTRPGQESRPVGRVLWVLHHHRASLGGAVHVMLGQGVASLTRHTCFHFRWCSARSVQTFRVSSYQKHVVSSIH